MAAEEAVELGRERIAKLIGATTKEIIFTSGATESDNLAIKGVARDVVRRVTTSSRGHGHAVLDTCKRLRNTATASRICPYKRRSGRS